MDSRRILFLALTALAVLISLVFAVLSFYEYSHSSLGLYALNIAFLFTSTLVLSLIALWRDKRAIGYSSFFLVIALVGLIYTGGVDMSGASAHFNHGRLYYATPHDSTIGVPNFVFIFIWILIILFFIRLAWEYRDKIFVKNEESKMKTSSLKRKKN